jgi:uncharacterized membrane protein
MNAPTPSTASSTGPSTIDFSAAWVCYALFGVAVFMWWPALIALLICYIKRGSPGAQMIDTHYTWLIRTFWWWLLLLIVCIAVIAAGAAPIARDLAEAIDASGGDWGHARLNLRIHWESIFLSVAIATAGLTSMLFVWFWVIYRVVRGAVRLGDARAVP